MSMNDIIGDMVTRIRNAQSQKLLSLEAKYSKSNEGILKVLKCEGYIDDFKVDNSYKYVSIKLKYMHDGTPSIKEIRRLSKLSCRMYSRIKSLNNYKGGMGIYILSTSRGVLSDKDAKNLNVGGELLCSVF